MAAAVTYEHDLTALHEKIDYLTAQIDEQRRRQEMWDELQRDMSPVINDLTRLMIGELGEVGYDFELEDILFLGKRLLRDVRLFVGILDQLESTVDLFGELNRMSDPAFEKLVHTLHMLEKKGYFGFAQGLADIANRVVEEFGEEDLKALGENVVTILKTVRNLTQPEIMTLTNNALSHMEEPIDDNVSTWTILREMRDPEVRKGIARLLKVVKGLAQEPTVTN